MTAAANASDRELIVVQISGQKFAIDIMSVREIRGWVASTRLPQSPAHVLGMINLRGSVLPVIDLSSCLGLGQSEPNAASVVIVAAIEDRTVGLLVDAVCDIHTLAEGALQPAPEVGNPRVHDFVRGLIPCGEEIITLLSLDPVIPRDEPMAA